MELFAWLAVVGLLLIVMALGDSLLSRLPLSTAMLYLAFGAVSGPWGLGWTRVDLLAHAEPIRMLCELVVLLSLFTCGLKLSAGLGDGRWRAPIRLATVSMLVTVALVAIVGWLFLDLSVGAAVLLGGILAPTDPVLASDVQVADPRDRDRLRFALTGEAGLNDGTAMPFVLLGLALLGVEGASHALGWRWLALEGVWASIGGVAIGALLGTLVGGLVLYLRRTHREAIGLDNFLGLGLVTLTYGLAQLAATNGFLAVFAAGLALRRVEQRETTAAGGADAGASRAGARAASKAASTAAEKAHADPDVSHAEATATHPKHAPAFMAHAVLAFNEQIERIGEVAAVVIVGMVLWSVDWSATSWIFIALLLFVVRPLATAIGLVGSPTAAGQRWLVAWFGVRGIGSIFYLTFAVHAGLAKAEAGRLAAIVCAAVVASIVLHGISVTPLMQRYEKRKTKARQA